MRSLMGAFVIALAACVGSGSPGAITGTPRPLGASGSGVDPTAGEIKVAPWGWTIDNVRSSRARMASTTDRETIRRAFREELGAILACYERGRRDDPDLRGIVRARFIIAMMFPEPSSVPVRVDMPFAFSPPPDLEPIAEVGPD
jgi:hypothetical protein